MAALPVTETETVAAIRIAREEAQGPRDGNRVAVSWLGNPCDRFIWYSFRWVTPPKRFDGRMLRLFETGHMEEARLIADLRLSGVTVVNQDARNPEAQIGVSFADGHAGGFLDGECSGVKEAPVTVHVLECKSHNHKSFTTTKNKGVKEGKPDHFAQVQTYMHLRHRSRALYIAVNKDTDEVWSERIDYDVNVATSLVLRAERIAYADRPPARIREDMGYPCTFCDHKAHCHEQAPARRNCRTCLHSTPVAGGKWICARFEHELTREAQQQGCPSHLLIPPLVHGEQIDADIHTGWVEYRMPDGALWRDSAEQAA